MFKKLLLTLFGGLLVVMMSLAAGFYGLRWYGDQQVSADRDTEFVIVPGDSLGRVVRRLSTDQLIQYPEVFEVFARMKGVAARLLAGEYLISPGITYRQLLHKFAEGDVRYYLSLIHI